MKLIRPKIIGNLKIHQMRAGNWAVVNDIKNSPNKIIIPCTSLEEGELIIEKIICAKEGDLLYFNKI